MADISAQAPITTDSIRNGYMAMTRRKRLYSGAMLALFVALMVAGFNLADDRNAGGFWDGWHNVLDFPAQVWGEAIEKAHELPGHFVTFFGALLGIMMSLLSTRGMACWPRMIPVFRRIMDILRAIPEIVIALVLIFILGGGPVPAMIAIALHTVGALGKLFSEVNENASLKPVEGLHSVGANWSQRMLLGIIPQVAPNYLSYALLRFEINIRASAILGFVGAGGSGYELKNAMSWGQGKFDEAAAIFILLFLTIVFFDQISSHYRDRLSKGTQQ